MKFSDNCIFVHIILQISFFRFVCYNINILPRGFLTYKMSQPQGAVRRIFEVFFSFILPGKRFFMYYDLTRGKISRSLILFALPMIAGNLR